jgi:rare lipoprotein A
MSIQKLSVGVLFAGLALSPSANGGAGKSAGVQPPSQPVQTAKPRHHSQRWLEVGIASWYGEHFQGRTTANGETFNMDQMTCAHPTLPMGTWLRVTNLKNRKAAFVRVNDRGPVVDGRIVDLSYAAARVIGLNGIGKVRLEQIHENDPALAQALVAQLQIPVLLDPMRQ